MFFETNSKYGTGFELNEYKGKISLISAQMGKDGKVYQRWEEIEIRKGETKRLPIAVELGNDRVQAVKILQGVIQFIQGNKDLERDAEEEKPPPYVGEDLDMPF